LGIDVFDKRNRWIVTLIMAIASVALTAVFIIPVFVAAFQSRPTSSTPSPSASAMSFQSDLESQARGYELVLQREPDNQTALQGLIDIRIKQRNIGAAIEPLEKLAALNPNAPEYAVLLAQVKQRVGDREGAAQAYRTILASRPGDLNALQGLIALLVSEGKPEAAIGLLQDTLQSADEANQVKPGSVDMTSVRILLGQVYAEGGRHEEAIEVLNQAIEGDRQDFRPLLGKAIVLQAQGKDEEAQPLFTSAADLAPAQYKDEINQIASEKKPNPLASDPLEANPAAAGDAETSPTPVN
jgi:Flp pilus assembly protein TadD